MFSMHPYVVQKKLDMYTCDTLALFLNITEQLVKSTLSFVVHMNNKCPSLSALCVLKFSPVTASHVCMCYLFPNSQLHLPKTTKSTG